MKLQLPSIQISGHNPIAAHLEKKIAQKAENAQTSGPAEQQLPPPPASKLAAKTRLNLGLAKVEITRPFSQIDHLLGSNNLRDVGGFFKRDGAKDAAKALFSPKVQTVMLPTGFSVTRDEETGRPLAESDGPIGTAILARELLKAGKKVVIPVDSQNLPLIKACLSKLHPDYESDPKLEIEVFDHQLLPGAAADAPERVELRQHAKDLLAKHNIADGSGAVFSVELPGRTADGKYVNMRGAMTNDINSARDELLLAAHEINEGKKKKDKIIVGGVGDGGNEAGATNDGKGIKLANDGSEMKSSVRSDFPVTAWNSNLGAIAVAAIGAQLGGRIKEFTKPQQLKDMTLALLQAGGVDGVTRKSNPGEEADTPTGKFVTGVDGKAVEVHMDDLERLSMMVQQEIKPQRAQFSELWRQYRT